MRIWWGFSCLGRKLARVPFRKVALGLADQVAVLETRGLIIADRASATEHLEHIGYYRFTGYTRPFRVGGGGADKENFRPGTTFDLVHERYIFDRKLRLLVMEAVEKIEIAVRAGISNSVATRHGPHWFMDQRFFSKPSWEHSRKPFQAKLWHDELIASIKREIGHDPAQSARRDVFIKHFYNVYDDPELPPCWMIFEAISFGTISRMFRYLAHPEHQDLCKKFGLNHQILSSWLHCVSYTRNMCAHHSRLWNRVCTIKPTIARQYSKEFPANDKVYAQLLVLQLLLKRVWSTNHWAENLRALIDAHPSVPRASMGFPTDWQAREVWSF